VELEDGSLMLNTRCYPKRIIAISGDNGQTWNKPYRDPFLTDSKLWGGCQASLIRYTRQDEGYDKNRILYASPSDTLSRFDMAVRISYDEGKTWPVSRVIKKGTGAYSGLTVFPDSSIGLVYETGNSNNDLIEYTARLSFARFNLEWLTEGKDQLIPGH
jgi:sialidase-1